MATLFIFLVLGLCQTLLGSPDFVLKSDSLSDDSLGDVFAAFGDFNADKLVDIFVIKYLGRQVDVLLAVQDKAFDRHTLIGLNNSQLADDTIVTGLMLADFDGDVQLDVLLITAAAGEKEKGTDRNMLLYWGNSVNISLDEEPYDFNGALLGDDPVLFDYNTDMLPDLLTPMSDGSNLVWLAQSSRTFARQPFSNRSLHRPHSGAYIDLVSDFNADLLLTTKDDYVIYANNDFSRANNSYPHPNGSFFGVSSFADFNEDGRIDHIVPVCDTEDCKQISQVVVYHQSAWTVLWTKSKAEPWHFLTSQSIAGFGFFTTLRIGDYDLDGYPDILAVMERGAEEPKAVLLRNIACSAESCAAFGRAFEIRDILPTTAVVSLATFFDLNEDGTLDILMTGVYNGSTIPKSIFVQNLIAEEACFLKTTVISGLCFNACPNGYKPYGVNVPGPLIKYQMTTVQGMPQTMAAGQLSQSAHFALQLPFVIFGLGPTPNFVDQIDTGIPHGQAGVARVKFWPQQIIPNSQLIVIPYPVNDTSSWKMQLFVTPSRKIYLTGIALLITCGLLAVIIAVLQWREMREDAQEKKQESQKFHFDAM